MSWYYAKNGQQIGPVEVTVLQNLYRAGQLAPGDLVWTDGMTTWLPASNIPAITGGFQAPPPSPVAQAPFPPQPQAQAPFPPQTTGQSPYPTNYYNPYATPTNNGKATASLVLGIFSLFCCGPLVGIIGIIFGSIALSEIKTNPYSKGRGMAIAGIVLSIVGIVGGIISTVFFMNHPEFFR